MDQHDPFYTPPGLPIVLAHWYHQPSLPSSPPKINCNETDPNTPDLQTNRHAPAQNPNQHQSRPIRPTPPPSPWVCQGVDFGRVEVIDVGVYVGSVLRFEGFCRRFEVGVEVGGEVSVGIRVRVGIGVVVVLRKMDRFVGVGASRRRYLGSVGKGGRHPRRSLMISYEVVLRRISI
jgi:hypothetical protein